MYTVKIACTIVLMTLCLWAAPSAQAQGGNAISQGFKVETAVTDGILVSIDPEASDTVQVATTESASRLIGVIATNALVTLSEGTQQAQVVISGTAWTRVSDINGPVKTGDHITISPINGIGMKATSEGQIVGIAQSGLDSQTSQTQQVTDRSGQSHQVHIGYVPVQIGTAYYTAPSSGVLPPFVQNLLNAIAGKPVGLMRAIIVLVLVLVGGISIAVIIYASARSSIASIGRNPLASKAIFRGLAQVGIYALSILGFTLLLAYLILTV